MNLEEKLHGAKQYSYEKLQVNIEEFENKLFNRLHRGTSLKKRTVLKKMAFVAIPFLIVPLLGFAAYSAKIITWSGTNFLTYSSKENHQNKGTNYADPGFATLVENDSKVHKFSLADASGKTNFPIRTPKQIAGWNRVVSEGLSFPYYHYNNGRLVKTSETPIEFYDVYTNDKGQRISIVQKQDPITDSMSQFLKKTKNPSLSGSPMNIELRKGAVVLQGFGQDMAVYSPNLIDVSPQQSSFNELTLYHIDENDTITQLQIDEFGGVGQKELEMVTHAYLQATVN